MSTEHSNSGPTAMDEPLASFSQCHAGITRQLQLLSELPPLPEPAAQARRIARDTVAFFRGAVHEHHANEEQALFPAVLASAVRGPEREQVQVIVDRLVAEHRQIEAMWSRLEPALRAVGKGLDTEAVQRLVDTYIGHARYEEQVFMPLSQTIFGRTGNHMAALGLSMHMRHSVPAMLERYGHIV